MTTPPANPGQATPTGHGGERRNGPAKVSAAEKARQAVELRKAGATFEEIATAVGYSNRGSAYRAIERALRDAVREPTLELIELESQRLDLMLRAVWPQVIRGSLGGIDRALRIADRRAKLLGLDAAQQVRHSGPDGGPIPVSIGELTPEERKARLEELVAEATRRLTEQTEATNRALVAGAGDAPAATPPATL